MLENLEELDIDFRLISFFLFSENLFLYLIFSMTKVTNLGLKSISESLGALKKLKNGKINLR